MVHSPGTIGTIPLTALASWETEWTSESVFKGPCRFSFHFYLQNKGQLFHLSYCIRNTTWRNPAGLLHETQQFPGMTAFHLNFPVQMVSVQGGTLSRLRSHQTWEQLCAGGMSLLSWHSHCWTVFLETSTPAANTECPQTPNIAFSSPPATAELTDGCTNLVCRCLGCPRRAFHPQ